MFSGTSDRTAHTQLAALRMSEKSGPRLAPGSCVNRMRPSPLNTNNVFKWRSGVLVCSISEYLANDSTLNRERRASQCAEIRKPQAPIVGCSVLFGSTVFVPLCSHSFATPHSPGMTMSSTLCSRQNLLKSLIPPSSVGSRGAPSGLGNQVKVDPGGRFATAALSDSTVLYPTTLLVTNTN